MAHRRPEQPDVTRFYRLLVAPTDDLGASCRRVTVTSDDLADFDQRRQPGASGSIDP